MRTRGDSVAIIHRGASWKREHQALPAGSAIELVWTSPPPPPETVTRPIRWPPRELWSMASRPQYWGQWGPASPVLQVALLCAMGGLAGFPASAHRMPMASLPLYPNPSCDNPEKCFQALPNTSCGETVLLPTQIEHWKFSDMLGSWKASAEKCGLVPWAFQLSLGGSCLAHRWA